MMVRSPLLVPVDFGTPKRVTARPAKPEAKSRIHTAIKAMYVPAWKILAGTVLAGLFGTVYLHHVFTTQAILREVTLLQQTYEKDMTRHDDLRFTYERMTGPADVYNRARGYGMVDGGPADDVIIMRN